MGKSVQRGDRTMYWS